MTVFALGWGTSALGFSRQKFLLMQLFDIVFFALTIPLSAVLAEHGDEARHAALGDRINRRCLRPDHGADVCRRHDGGGGDDGVGLLSLMGDDLRTVVGHDDAAFPSCFRAAVRYTGSSLAFNFAGILGASLAPYIATWLATTYGLQYVGYYLSASAVLTLVGLFLMRETKDEDLAAVRARV